MDNKLSLYNIAELLADKIGLTQPKAEKFVEGLIAFIVDGITKDQLVKVKGLGTFKVILVKERESVHVNTGERIVIPAHHKLSFIPDKTFKDLINKPFSFFETIEANNDNVDLQSLDIDDFDDEDEVNSDAKEENSPVNSSTSDEVHSNDLLDDDMMDLPPSEIVFNTPILPPESLHNNIQSEDITGDEGVLDIPPSEVVFNPPLPTINHSTDEASIDPVANNTMKSASSDDIILGPPPIPTSQLKDTQTEGELDDKDTISNEIVYGPPPIPTQKEISTIKTESVKENILSEDRPVSKGLPTEIQEEKKEESNKKMETETKKAPPKKAVPKKESKKSYTFLYIILVFLLLVLAGCVWYYFSFSKFDSFFSDNNPGRYSGDTFAFPGDSNAIKEAEERAKTDTTLLKTSDNESIREADLPTNSQVESANIKPKTDSSTVKKTESNSTTRTSATNSNKVIARVSMDPGSRLTLIAEKYYGDKIFWVYIYEYNKKKIGANPNNIPTGMQILVPAKEVYGIDANDASSREKARTLQSKIMSKL